MHSTQLSNEIVQFTAFLRNGQVRDMVCFYDTAEKKYYTVLQLGRCTSKALHKVAIVYKSICASMQTHTFVALPIRQHSA